MQDRLTAGQHDPAAFHEPGGRKDRWPDTIPCRRGHICVHSDTQPGLWWQSKARLDLEHPFLSLYQDGDDEKVYVFAPEDFEAITEPAGARKRRTLAPAQREAAILRRRPFQKP